MASGSYGHGNCRKKECLYMSPKSVDTLERGNVYFFFRPKVEKTPEKLEDVQRMLVVLNPEESQGFS